MTQTTPAGWYDDGSGRLRYWDGDAWTDHFHDAQPVAAETDNKAAAAEAKAAEKAAQKTAADEAKAVEKAAFERLKAARKAADDEAKAAGKAAAEAAKAAGRDAAARERAAREAQKAADQAAFRERAGSLVKKGAFGGKIVEIYENGFVRVGGPFGVGSAPLEELRTITFRRASRDKGAGGRAVGALATGGLNLLASKEKVQAYLSIATSVSVHQLSSSQASAAEERTGMALEAAGQSVIDLKRHAAPPVTQQAAAAPAPQVAAAAPRTIPEQIRDLAALHADGILSDEEFASSKANLLSQM